MDPGHSDSATPMLLPRGSRDMTLLLADSIVQVAQRAPVLPAAVQEALRADTYAAASTGGVDADSDMAYCATAQHVLAWRCSSAAPTAFQFAAPPCTAPAVPPFCSFLPRPLSTNAEASVLLCSASGRLSFWSALSDALTMTSDNASALPSLPLRNAERVTAMARVNDSQVLTGTSLGRLFRICVRMHHDEQSLVVDELAMQRGLLGRWLGGSSMRESELAVQALVVSAPIDTGHVLAVAISVGAVHVWRLPVGTFAETQAPSFVMADMDLGKTIAARSLYLTGTRYSAAIAQHIQIIDGAYESTTNMLALLVKDNSQSTAHFGIAVLPLQPNMTAINVHQWVTLQYEQAHDPRALAQPTLHLSQSRPSIAFVSFPQAVVAVLISEHASQEESLRLRNGSNRIIGGCVPTDPECVRWIGLTSESGMLHVYVDAQRAMQHMQDLQPNSPRAQDARAGRLEECLERAMCFDEPQNPLQLDALPEHMDKGLVEIAIRHVSSRLLDSSLRRLRPTVDLRTQLAQRSAFAQRLIEIVGRSGYLVHLSVTLRAMLRANAELLAGAGDLWRYYDTGTRMSLMGEAIELVLGTRNERLFFETGLAQVPTLFYALHRLLTPANSVECTRLTLALLLGSLRYREENTKLYLLPLIPQVEFEPWYACSVCIELLERLFDLALQRHEADMVDTERRPHMCALAELILDAYDARMASILTDKERTEVAESFVRARSRLLHSLQSVSCGDKAYELAERHCDYRTLVQLCMNERRADGEHSPVDVRIEHYLDTLGLDFADELYLYYIQQREFRRLLEPRTEHAELVTAFFKRHERYAKISWLHGINLDQFASASSTLRQSADVEEDVVDKQSMLSLSKLMYLGSLMSPSIEEEHLQRQLEDWDDALDLVMVQRRLFKRWCDTLMMAASTPEVLAENVASVLATRLDQQPALHSLFVELAISVADARVVTALDMAELLSLSDRSFAARPEAALNDPTVAIQLLARMVEPSDERNATLACIWRRVYLLDDWHELGDITTLSDDDVLERIYGTVAFQTARAVLLDLTTLNMFLEPEVLSQIPPPSMDILRKRFPGLAEEQLRSLEAAMTEEHEALQVLCQDTKLIIFMDRAAAKIDDEKRSLSDVSVHRDHTEATRSQATRAPMERGAELDLTMPGAAPVPPLVTRMDECL